MVNITPSIKKYSLFPIVNTPFLSIYQLREVASCRHKPTTKMEIYVVILTLIELMKKVYGEWVKKLFWFRGK